MKRFQVFIRCRELAAAHAEYTYSLNAGQFHTAVTSGIKLFRREPHVRSRHVKCIEIRVTVVGDALPTPPKRDIVLPLFRGGAS